MKRYLCLGDFEAAARRQLPRSIYGYIAGGAEDGASVRGNRAAFDRLGFQTRCLVDTSSRSTAVSCLGQTWAAPFGIAPMGAVGAAAFRADLALAGAAAAAAIPFVLSGSSLVAMERVLRENAAAWFQAYLSADAALDRALVARVADCGFRTLVLTVDVPVPGNRENDLRNGYSSPLRPSARVLADVLLHPRWLVGTFLRSLLAEGMPHFENLPDIRVPMYSLRAPPRPHRREKLCWDDVVRVREQWRGRLVLKGVLSAADVALACAAGIDAVIASNHGGRQLDGAVSPLQLLPGMVAEAGAMTLCLDSGVRRGTDVLKAVARGAALAFIGRPFLYAAVAGGRAGVERAIGLLRAEIDRDLALLGCKAPGEVAALTV